MDESTLRAFLSLCETENTRDTAAALRVNQSNVSRALARLEAELGAELFTRHGRRLELNRAGAAFRADAVRIVEGYDAGRRHLLLLTGPDTTVRLGFLQSTARRLVPRLIGSFRTAAPHARFELRQGFARELDAWIADDQLDVAIVTPPAAHVSGLGWRGLLEQRLCVAVPATHPFADRHRLSARELNGLDFIAFDRSTELRAAIDPILQSAEVVVRLAFESSEIDTIRGLVAAGLGVAVLPEPAASDVGDLRYVPLEPAHTRRLGLAWSTERANPASVIAFLEHSAGVDLR